MSSAKLPIQSPNSSWAYNILIDTDAKKILITCKLNDARILLTKALHSKYTSYKNDRLLTTIFSSPTLPVYMKLNSVKKEKTY